MPKETRPEKSLEEIITDLQKQLKHEKVKKDMALKFIKMTGRGQEFADFCEGPDGVDAL